MIKPYHENPDDPGFVIADVDDPTGNNEPTQALAARNEHGAIFRSGLVWQVHGGGPFGVRFGLLSPDAGAEAFFEIDPATGKLAQFS